MKKIGIISQARMTSTRLPGKVLLKIKEKSILDYHLERLQQSGLQVYIATTTNSTDDIICSWAEQKRVPFYRGDEQNVLNRYYNCAAENNLDIIVRVTSDCPLIDGYLIREALNTYLESQDEDIYLTNGLQRTFPRGFDFEVFSFKHLQDAFHHAILPSELEHVTPYIKYNKSGNVKVKHFLQKEDKSMYRITLDVEEDFLLIKKLIETYNVDILNQTQITSILDAHPDLVQINSHITQKHE